MRETAPDPGPAGLAISAPTTTLPVASHVGKCIIREFDGKWIKGRIEGEVQDDIGTSKWVCRFENDERIEMDSADIHAALHMADVLQDDAADSGTDECDAHNSCDSDTDTDNDSDRSDNESGSFL